MKISWKNNVRSNKKVSQKDISTCEGMEKSQDNAGILFLGAGFNNLTKLHHQRKVQTIRKLKSKSDWIKRKKNVLEKTENK